MPDRPGANDTVSIDDGLVLVQALEKKPDRPLDTDRVRCPRSFGRVTWGRARPERMANLAGIASGTRMAELSVGIPGMSPRSGELRGLNQHPPEEHASPLKQVSSGLKAARASGVLDDEVAGSLRVWPNSSGNRPAKLVYGD